MHLEAQRKVADEVMKAMQRAAADAAFDMLRRSYANAFELGKREEGERVRNECVRVVRDLALALAGSRDDGGTWTGQEVHELLRGLAVDMEKMGVPR